MTDKVTTVIAVELDQTLVLLSQMADQIRETLQKSRLAIPPEALDSLSQLSGGLVRASRQVRQKEEERKNLLALADIGQVVNSSLELSEVLRIVMDTIVRLTGAERGFLMLRDASDGELSIRIARNWEQESINASEFAISRTIVNRVVSEGQALLTTNAQEDPLQRCVTGVHGPRPAVPQDSLCIHAPPSFLSCFHRYRMVCAGL